MGYQQSIMAHCVFWHWVYCHKTDNCYLKQIYTPFHTTNIKIPNAKKPNMREYQTPIYPNNNNFDAHFHIGCSFYIQNQTRKDQISKQKAKQDSDVNYNRTCT